MIPRATMVSESTFKKWYAKQELAVPESDRLNSFKHMGYENTIPIKVIESFMMECPYFDELMEYLREKCVLGNVSGFVQFIVSPFPNYQMSFWGPGLNKVFVRRVIMPWIEKWQERHRENAPPIVIWRKKICPERRCESRYFGLCAGLTENEVANVRVTAKRILKSRGAIRHLTMPVRVSIP